MSRRVRHGSRCAIRRLVQVFLVLVSVGALCQLLLPLYTSYHHVWNLPTLAPHEQSKLRVWAPDYIATTDPLVHITGHADIAQKDIGSPGKQKFPTVTSPGSTLIPIQPLHSVKKNGEAVSRNVMIMQCLTIHGSNDNLNGIYMHKAYKGSVDEYCREDRTMVIRAGDSGWNFCRATDCVVILECLGPSGRQGYIADEGGHPSRGMIHDWLNRDPSSVSSGCSNSLFHPSGVARDDHRRTIGQQMDEIGRDANKAHEGPMTTFVRHGGQFPILLLSHERPALLRNTLRSLSKVRGFTKDRLFVAQDGDNANVSAIIDEQQVRSAINRQPKIIDKDSWRIPARKIANHYKWSLDMGFSVFTDAPGIIVAEDDLLFAPDFLEYMDAVAPLIEYDSTLWAASAWNDNGFTHLVHDAKHLQRTSFMPGLGWLMPRQLWERELQKKWPKDTNWDHWMRDPRQHAGREVIFPQVPRVFHAGSVGTFMQLETHRKYFATIATNRDKSLAWAKPTEQGFRIADQFVTDASLLSYETYVESHFQYAQVVDSVEELREVIDKGAGINLTAWICVDPNPALKDAFQHVANFLGIWHEAKRSAHRGVHDLWFGDIHFFLVNIHPGIVSSSNGGRDPEKCDSAATLMNDPRFGRPLVCNAKGNHPCCSPSGWCGNTRAHCSCDRCMDPRNADQMGYAHLMPETARLLHASDFNGLRPLPRLPPPRALKVGFSGLDQ